MKLDAVIRSPLGTCPSRVPGAGVDRDLFWDVSRGHQSVEYRTDPRIGGLDLPLLDGE